MMEMERSEAYKLLERQQWNLFISSGSQLPRRQRKWEREEEYKVWLEREQERKWNQKQMKVTKNQAPAKSHAHAQAKPHARFPQHAERESSVGNEDSIMTTTERREAYKILERQQWERFVSSGSQLPRRQRKRELRSCKPHPQQKRIIQTQGPSAPTSKGTIGADNGVPNRPEPPSESADKPARGSLVSFPATTRNERRSHGQRLRSGFRGWLKNRLGL
jgi:hypothetical protein